MSHEDSGSWDALEATWQEDAERPGRSHHSELIARLGRRRRWIDGTVRVGEWLVVLVFGSLAVHWLWMGSPADRVAGGFVLTVLVIVSILRRHAWFGRLTTSTDAPTRFVQALLERNAAGQRAVRLGGTLLAVLVVFFVAWLPWSTDSSQLPGAYTFLSLWTVGYVVALRASSRFLHRERRRLEALRDELDVD